MEPTERTLITVEEARRLLDKLDPTDQLSGRTRANTGNLVIIRGGRAIGWVDLRDKEIYYYEE